MRCVPGSVSSVLTLVALFDSRSDSRSQIKLVFFILILYGVAGFILTVSFLKESEPAYAIFYGMYVVETAIPPLIPTVFLVSVGISAERLLWKRIACADNREILVTGKVKMAFFDKTGTLVSHKKVSLNSRHVP